MTTSTVLLVDFGASRVKAALYHLNEDRILAQAERPAPQPRMGEGGEVEVDPRSYATLLGDLARELNGRQMPAPASIWLCSEMHGFILDDGSGQPLTPYISWRDTRAANARPGEPESLLGLCDGQIGKEFHKISGMRIKAGLPFLNLLHLAKSGVLPRQSRFLSLPEWIAVSAGEYSGNVHVSMAAGSGLYDLNRKEWSPRLTGLLGETAGSIRFGAPSSSDGVSLGAVRIAGRQVPLYGGFGDMQTALLGAGVPQRAAAAVNLGTGSQVARALSSAAQLTVERRPYFDGRELAAITHIPSGRALNLFAAMFDDIAAIAGGASGAFWKLFGELEPDAILAAPLRVDLNVFPGAWRFRDGGALTGLVEGTQAAVLVVASIARGWLEQYASALDAVDPGHDEHEVVLAGGLVRRCKSASTVLEHLAGRRMLLPDGDTEETIAGLASLARRTMNG